MALGQGDSKHKINHHCKKTRQGAGGGTKCGHKKGSYKKYRGQGGKKRRIH